MSGYCSERWKLYGAWSMAIRQVRMNWGWQPLVNATRLELEEHHRTCPICKAHVREMTEMAREATMPEYEDEE